MYKTKDITPQELKALAIKNQDEILELTGSKLDPVKAWEVIKNNSQNFTKADLKAQEADSLLYQILHPGKKSKKESKSKETILIQEKERARALALLELELLIAA